jgi:alpha-glucoside transport system permease protein
VRSGLRRFAGGHLVTILFLGPALLVMAALVLYPIGYTTVRSLFGADGTRFVGLHNYWSVFTSGDTLTALRNNAIWVVVAPTVVTVLGLFFAVLTERIKWATAFKAIVFMPMAISFLAAGVTFRLVYDQDPGKGMANAVVVGVHDTFAAPSPYPGARPRDPGVLRPYQGGYQTATPVRPGQVARLPLVGIAPADLPARATDAALPAAGRGLTGVVWLDLRPGGGGSPGELDTGKRGMPGVTVQAVAHGSVVATTTTDAHGRYALPGLTGGAYTLRLPAANFAAPFGGVSWLGPSLVTPAIIGSYIWIWAGFAMVLIVAGLSAIPREALEAARVDGATEWQVFRRVTVPLVRPVLVVVVVTLVINVLKIFDLVLVLAPESVQSQANVIALDMWRVSFGGGQDQGLGSALGVLLFLLVLPAMLFNVRRFRHRR